MLKKTLDIEPYKRLWALLPAMLERRYQRQLKLFRWALDAGDYNAPPPESGNWSEQRLLLMFEMRNKGYTMIQIGEVFDISPSVVSDAMRRAKASDPETPLQCYLQTEASRYY